MAKAHKVWAAVGGATLVAFTSPVYAQASSSQTATDAPPPHPAPRPVSVDDLDCKSLDVNFSTMQPDLLPPGPYDPKVWNAQITPELMQRIIRSSQVDPNGLCHYRDANRTLGPAGRRRVVFMGDSITENREARRRESSGAR